MNSVLSMMAMGALLAEKMTASGNASAPDALKQAGIIDVDDVAPARFAIEWHRCGFPRVVLSRKHAAALMATSAPPDGGLEVRAPWPAFVVDVPEGLVASDMDGKWVTRMFVHIPDDGFVIGYYGDDAEFFANAFLHGALYEASGERWMEYPAFKLGELGGARDDDPVRRLLCRLTLGVCMEMMRRAPTWRADAHAKWVEICGGDDSEERS